MRQHERYITRGGSQRGYNGILTEPVVVCTPAAYKVTEALNKHVALAYHICKARNALGILGRLVKRFCKAYA